MGGYDDARHRKKQERFLLYDKGGGRTDGNEC
jgi:hypothetical protein